MSPPGVALVFAALVLAAPREAPTTDPRTAAKLEQAVEHLQAERWGQAREILEPLHQKRQLSPYESARVERMLAAAAQGEAQYDEARRHLGEAIASGGLSEGELADARFSIAQLFMAEERWQAGIEALRAWMASGAKPEAHAYYLLAAAHYRLGQSAQAVEAAQRAVDLQVRPDEAQLGLLASLRLEREEWAQAAPLLARLVGLAPAKKLYWTQLSSVLWAQGKSDEALAVMQLAYAGGSLTEPDELRRLADLLLRAGVPRRAAEVLAAGIEQHTLPGEREDFERLGQAWLAARHPERALPALERAAALAQGGEAYLRLAAVHVEREDWAAAVSALDRARERGGLTAPAAAELLLGVALLGAEQPQRARQHFLRAAEDPERRAEAEGWLRFLDDEGL